MPELRGRCLCGGVVFELSGDIGMASHCHCSVCRKNHGSAFGSAGAVTADAFRLLSGAELRRSFESSPGGYRWFCQRCGSKVPAENMPGFVFVTLGNLDEDPRTRPLAHIFTGSKAPWYEITGDLPQFTEYPPGFDATAFPDPVREPAPAGHVRGSCLCGEVAYEIQGKIDVIRHCHCSRCRRARSAAHATNGFVEAERCRFLRGQDVLESYKVPDAERFRQSFCRRCGSPMPHAIPTRPFWVIPMGSVEGDPGSRPSEHIFVGSKAPWYEITDSLPQHVEYPT